MVCMWINKIPYTLYIEMQMVYYLLYELNCHHVMIFEPVLPMHPYRV